jgi:hypothetical protein
MIWLYVLVEGQTEFEFIESILEPHLRERQVWVSPIVVETSRDAFGRKRGGGGRWSKWRRDLKRLTSQHPGNDVRFTTLFDLYGLPADFPSLEKYARDRDTVRRAQYLEEAMAVSVDDWRLVPYIQRHEFETLVLASLDVLAGLIDNPGELDGLARLRALLAQTPPEEVNDGKTTAPSKRLENLIPSYRKTVHGPLALQGAGLVALRKACPRFDAWVSKLERLGEKQP